MENKSTIILFTKLIALATLASGQTLYIPEEIQNFYGQEKIKPSYDINATVNP
jgi:hypothetical protein